MNVKNICDNRSIILPSGQRLAPGEIGKTPRTKPIMAMIKGEYLEEIPSQTAKPRMSEPVSMVKDKLPPLDEFPPVNGGAVLSDFLKKNAKQAKHDIKRMVCIEDLQALFDLEGRSSVKSAIKSRIAALKG